MDVLVALKYTSHQFLLLRVPLLAYIIHIRARRMCAPRRDVRVCVQMENGPCRGHHQRIYTVVRANQLHSHKDWQSRIESDRRSR